MRSFVACAVSKNIITEDKINADEMNMACSMMKAMSLGGTLVR
jgi:hypothetical protein